MVELVITLLGFNPIVVRLVGASSDAKWLNQVSESRFNPIVVRLVGARIGLCIQKVGVFVSIPSWFDWSVRGRGTLIEPFWALLVSIPSWFDWSVRVKVVNVYRIGYEWPFQSHRGSIGRCEARQLLEFGVIQGWFQSHRGSIGRCETKNGDGFRYRFSSFNPIVVRLVGARWRSFLTRNFLFASFNPIVVRLVGASTSCDGLMVRKWQFQSHRGSIGRCEATGVPPYGGKRWPFQSHRGSIGRCELGGKRDYI